MILTCPKCASRFLLSAQVLAPEGRRVKCSNCGEVWHEMPDADELLKDLESEAPPIEDIPDAVKPIPEGSSVPAIRDEDDAQNPADKRITAKSMAVAAVVVVILCMPLFVMKDTIMGGWPESIAFYKAVGLVSEAPGEGLVFDRLNSKIDGDTITVTGQIINLTSRKKSLPLIEVSLRDGAGEIVSSWAIRPPQNYLDGEAVLPLKAEYKAPDIAKAQDIRIRFILKAPKMQKKDEGEDHMEPDADHH